MKCFKVNTLLSQYVKRLEEDKIGFLNGKDDVRADLQKLIIALKQHIASGQQNEQLETAQSIWKLLMVNALGQISISKSVRGFGTLYEYYGYFVEFENVLFGVDSTYRDHTMHTLWVYLLGDYVLSRPPFIRESPIDWDINVGKVTNVKDALVYKQQIEGTLNKYKDAVYCIIALSHDLAYPFEKVEKVNKELEKVAGYIGIRAFEHLQYSFSEEQSMLIHELLEFVSQKPVITKMGKANRLRFVKDNPTFVDMSQSFEQHRHGILSSYLLYRLIDTIGEVTFTEVGYLPDEKNLIINLIVRKTILHAIASHTCDYAYSTVFNSFKFLLSLFDELEEFSRYKRQGRDDVDEICKSGLTFPSSGQLAIEYKFEKNHIAEPKPFFASRAIRFSRMVEVNENNTSLCGITELIMSCVDAKSSGKPLQYSLKINKTGVFCIGPSDKDWILISPDPETEIRKRFK